MATCKVNEESVIQQLNELFGNSLSLDIINTVASQCQFDVHQSSNILLEMSTSTGTIPKNITQPLHINTTSPNISKKSKDIQRAIRNIKLGHKVLVLMRGVPGCGKSFLSRQVLEQTVGLHTGQPHILSSDDYFMVKDRYNYNPNMIGDAHGWNHNRAFNAMRIGVSPVIIDNTNTQLWEMRPYASMACDFGYLVEILEPDTHWCFNDKELARRNTHGVPRQKIKEMIDRYQKNITPVKLLAAFNLTYKANRKPPQLRSIPPVVHKPPHVPNTMPNSVSLNDAQMRHLQRHTISSSVNCSPMHQIFPTTTTETNKTNEMINLMEFEDENGAQCKPSNTQQLNTSAWNNKSVDDILMLNGNGSSDVLQPNNQQTIGRHKWTLFDNIENKWGVSEASMKSWDFVEPLNVREETQTAVTSTTTEPQPTPKQENSSNTDPSDFVLIKNGTYLVGCKTLTTTNRNINQNTPHKPATIPKKTVVEKSCSTDDDAQHEYENQFCSLISMFPHIKVDIIRYWFDKCKGDLEWTIELLLNNESETVSLLANDEMNNHQTIAHHDQMDNVDMLKTNPKRKLNRTDEEAQQLKRSIEEKVNIGNEFYSNRLLKVKGQPIAAEPSTSSHQSDTIPIDSDDDDFEHSGETIEVNLGNSFVTQLETQFGDATLVYPKGLQPVVQMPMELARQIYMLYMESIFQQLDTQHQIMEQLVKEDEEFARKLAREDDIKSTTTPNLNEIMDEEKHYKKILDEWRKLSPDTLADRLTKQKLYDSFPSVNREAILEIYHANNSNYQDTIETILESVGEDQVNGTLEHLREPPMNETIINDLKEAQSECVQRVDEEHEAKYYRETASRCIQKRNELYEKARQYSQRGMTEVAQYYTCLAVQQTDLYDRANNMAAQAFLEDHAKRLKDFNTLDLHYLYVKEAIPALDVFIDRNINLLKGSKTKQSEYLHVITGRGKRSKGGVSRIKPEVIKHLNKRDIKYVELNPGLLKIKVTANSKVTNNI